MPSLSKTAIRCDSGTKSRPPRVDTAVTNVTIRCLVAEWFHDASGSAAASGTIETQANHAVRICRNQVRCNLDSLEGGRMQGNGHAHGNRDSPVCGAGQAGCRRRVPAGIVIVGVVAALPMK